jgi:hypothetical protein
MSRVSEASHTNSFQVIEVLISITKSYLNSVHEREQSLRQSSRCRFGEIFKEICDEQALQDIAFPNQKY